MKFDANRVSQLDFSDLYLGHPLLGDRFSDVPGSDINPLPANEILREDLDQLKDVCRVAKSRALGMMAFKVNYDGVAYRASVMNTLSGEVFVLRKLADSIGSLFEIGIPQAYSRRLMSKDLSGLFIVAGGIKAGKTTTACAMIKERLTQYGGIAVTAEDPIELPLEGCHGAGVCYQTNIVRETGGYVGAFRQIVRWGAKIIFLGEIHDPDIAVEVLEASANGHLVISTVHSENVVKTISKLNALVNEKLDSVTAQTLLADGLAGVLHQQLIDGTKKKQLETEFLFLKDSALARNNVRQGKFEMLASDIRQQMSSMIAVNATAQRYAVV